MALVLDILLVAAFLMSGSTKVFGLKFQVESFQRLRLPQWFRVFTGLTQYIGVAALVVGFWEPSWAAWAGIWFAFIMLCATAAHIRVGDSGSKTAPAVVLMILAIALAIAQGAELGHFPG
ncbi:DoxX family protein [Cohnella zeiphila]|uniref:DoxX family protein n=1 Tax=Cohnella zeiphila TaxID=2761120 RepID=UPI001EE36671|nr:DoxX family protein [Cohnella zeiphila]